MAGINLAAIGAGLGQWAQYMQQQRAQQERQQMLAMQLATFQQQQKKLADEQQLAASEWGLAKSAMDAPPSVKPLGGNGDLSQLGNVVPGTSAPAEAAPSQSMRAGGGLSIENMTQLAEQAGFPPDKAAIMAAISMPESHGDPNAYNPRDPHGGSYGITQINGVHPGAASARGDPLRAMQLAFDVSKGGTDFSPWSGYTSGAYKSYLRPGGTGQGRTSPSMGPGRTQMASVAPQTATDATDDGYTPPARISASDANRMNAADPGAGSHLPVMSSDYIFGKGKSIPQGAGSVGGAPPPVTSTPGGTNGIVPAGAPRGQQMVQAGPPTATDAPDPAVRQANRQLEQIITPEMHRKMSQQGLVSAIARIPGLNDEQRGKLFMERWKQLAPEEQEYTREFMQQNTQRHQDEMQDRRFQQQESNIDRRAREAADKEKNKWSEPRFMQDEDHPKGVWVQVNNATGDVRTVPKLGGATVTKMGSPKTGSSTPMDEADAKFWAGVIAQGGSLPTGLRRSGVVEQVMKQVPGVAPNMTPGDFVAAHSGVQANTGSLRNMTKMADAAISFEKLAEKNFDVALRLAPDAVPTELGPFFNQWIERGETMLGDPNVPPYVAAMLTGANEYAKVMSGSTGTAASTNDSRRQAAEMFSPYFSLPQISQVIAVAKADMKNRENTLTEQVSQIQKRLGSSAPVTTAPPATPKATGQESQNAPAAAGAPPGAQDAVPVPAGLASDPDGTSYEKDGAMWVKRGNQLVKTPGAVRTQ